MTQFLVTLLHYSDLDTREYAWSITITDQFKRTTHVFCGDCYDSLMLDVASWIFGQSLDEISK